MEREHLKIVLLMFFITKLKDKCKDYQYNIE